MVRKEVLFVEGGDSVHQMHQALEEFIINWNSLNDHFIFSVQREIFARGSPTEIRVRYSAAKYQDFFSTEKWTKLKDVVEAKSHGTMYVVTDEFLFERGIVDIKVAAANHNYTDRITIGVLRWIAEGFFPN